MQINDSSTLIDFLTKIFFSKQDDIIPENVRKTIEEEEKNKEMEDLYLPPRRKNMNQNNSDLSKFYADSFSFFS